MSIEIIDISKLLDEFSITFHGDLTGVGDQESEYRTVIARAIIDIDFESHSEGRCGM